MPITALPSLLPTSPTFKAEVDTFFGTQLPAFSVQAEAARVEVNADKITSGTSAVNAAASATISSASANFKGNWSALTGALNMPASVSHLDTFWALASNLANVATATPGVSAAWVPIIYGSIPQNSQSAAYTLTLTDAGKHLLHPSADVTARTFTIPANGAVAYPIGTAITFINQASAGLITIAITTDVMRWSPLGTTGSRSLQANGIATIVKVAATDWIINGSGLL